MIYQWLVKAAVGDAERCEIEVLAKNEEQARDVFEVEVSDWSTGPIRYKSVTKTGMVLVHENQVKGDVK